MDIICSCTSCQAKFKVGQHAAGKKDGCPKCATVVQVPSADIEASAPQTAVPVPRAVAKAAAPPVRSAGGTTAPAPDASPASNAPVFPALADSPAGRPDRRGKAKGKPL